MNEGMFTNEWKTNWIKKKQTSKQTKPLYEDAYSAYDTVGLGYNPGKLAKCKWFLIICKCEKYSLANIFLLESSISPKHAIDRWWLLGQWQLGDQIFDMQYKCSALPLELHVKSQLGTGHYVGSK